MPRYCLLGLAAVLLVPALTAFRSGGGGDCQLVATFGVLSGAFLDDESACQGSCDGTCKVKTVKDNNGNIIEIVCVCQCGGTTTTPGHCHAIVKREGSQLKLSCVGSCEQGACTRQGSQSPDTSTVSYTCVCK